MLTHEQIPVPPFDMAMPALNAIVTGANFSLLAVVTILVVREARRTRSLIPVLILIGAGLASLLEPIFDLVGAVWYPEQGGAYYTRAFNVSIPLWLIPAYAWYIGGQGNLMLNLMRRGLTARQLWGFYGLFWIANFMLEMPGLNLDVYRYYGAQPFKVLGFPLWMAMTNALMPLLIGALFQHLRAALAGPAVWLTIVIVPMVVGSAQIGVGWPVWLALNNGSQLWGTQCAALISLSFAFVVVHLVAATSAQGAMSAQGATAAEGTASTPAAGMIRRPAAQQK